MERIEGRGRSFRERVRESYREHFDGHTVLARNDKKKTAERERERESRERVEIWRGERHRG